MSNHQSVSITNWSGKSFQTIWWALDSARNASPTLYLHATSRLFDFVLKQLENVDQTEAISYDDME